MVYEEERVLHGSVRGEMNRGNELGYKRGKGWKNETMKWVKGGRLSVKGVEG